MSEKINTMAMDRGKAATVTIVSVTPALARKWLGNAAANRPLSEQAVNDYARQMVTGEWRYTGDPIRFNESDELIDGQHRLTALLKAGVTLDMTVVSGLHHSTMRYMDLGRRRTVVHQLAIDGVPNAPDLSTVANLLIRWQNGWLTNRLEKPTVNEVVQYVYDYEDRIVRACQYGRSVRKEVRGSISVHGAVFFRAAQKDVYKAAEFFTALASGVGLEQGDPRLALRNMLIRNRATSKRLRQNEELIFTIRAWNAFRTGEELGRMQPPREVTANHFVLK